MTEADLALFDPVSNKLFDHLRDVARQAERQHAADCKRQQEQAETLYEMYATQIRKALESALAPKESPWREAMHQRSVDRTCSLALDAKTIGEWPHGTTLLGILDRIAAVDALGTAEAIPVDRVRTAVATHAQQKLAEQLGRSHLFPPSAASPCWTWSWKV